MKQPNRLLKLAAVASSVVLLAGFLSYRAGAFDWIAKPAAPTESVENSTPAEPDPSAAPAQGALLYGSKSGKIVIPAAPTPSGQPSVNLPPELISSSKSTVPLIPPPAKTDPPQPPQ